MGELRRQFRPEFLNRVDDIIFFKPLTAKEIGSIVYLLVEELQRRLEDRHVALRLTPQAVDFIVTGGFDPVYGARPLRRFLQRQVETLIARGLIGGKIMDGAQVTVDSDGEELKLSWKNPGEKQE